MREERTRKGGKWGICGNKGWEAGQQGARSGGKKVWK